jgi:hypothetical protein
MYNLYMMTVIIFQLSESECYFIFYKIKNYYN